MFNRTNPIFTKHKNISWTTVITLIKRCKHENTELLSALYVSSRYKGKDRAYPVLRPDLDYDGTVANWDEIKRSTAMRKMHLPELLETTSNDIKQNIQHLKLNESALQENVTSSREDKSRNTNDFAQLTAKRQALRETIWRYENHVVPLLLKRPNVLHPDTGPERKIISRSGNCDSLRPVECHVNLGRRKNWLEFPNVGPSVCYMVGKLAQLELAIIDYFQARLRIEQYRNISAPNIVQTAIIEACGKNPLDPDSAILLKGKKEGLVQEYLVGSATLEALTAFLTRMVIAKSALPMHLYSIGRHYACKSDTSMGLYGTAQSTRIECLAVCEKSDDMVHSFNGMVDALKKAYEEIGIPYQVVIVSAEELKPSEMIRIQLEVWSSVMKQYVPCSSVSMYSDYLSKRLMIQYRINKTVQGYAHCVGATALSVPVLIASLMENFQENGNFSIPAVLETFML